MNQSVSVHYTVAPVNPEAHHFAVSCRVDTPSADGQLFRLPAWIPGSYLIRDFAQHVIELTAVDSGGQELLAEKRDKSTWLVAPTDGPITVRYLVYAWDLSVRGAYLDASRGFFNGTSLFLEAVGLGALPCSVELFAPTKSSCSEWRVATTLPRAGAGRYQFGRYQAADYAALIDHPVEMGEFDSQVFDVAGVRHEIAISGRHSADMSRLANDLQRICGVHCSLFGGRFPGTEYLFTCVATGDQYGGLEHRSSTALMCSRGDLFQDEAVRGDGKMDEGYLNFLTLCSHEYFHSWSVKRIKPARFVPYDLSKETPTRLLWVFEGITVYYEALALVRCNLISRQQYLNYLAQQLSRVQRGKGRYRQTLEESSFDAWIKLYKAGANAADTLISYYTKGALVALALDLTLREKSAGACSLDDIMRELWKRYGDGSVGVSEGGFEALVSELSGFDLSHFFDLALRCPGEVEIASLLRSFGVAMELRVATGVDDKGGISVNGDTPRQVLGVKFQSSRDDGLVLAQVFEGGAAQLAGLSAGDEIIAVDGLRVDAKGLQQAVSRATKPMSIHGFRRDELIEFAVTPQPPVADRVVLTLIEERDVQNPSKRDAWLGHLEKADE